MFKEGQRVIIPKWCKTGLIVALQSKEASVLIDTNTQPIWIELSMLKAYPSKVIFKEGQEVLVKSEVGNGYNIANLVAYNNLFSCVEYADYSKAIVESNRLSVERPYEAKPIFQEGQEVWVAFKDSSNKYKATVLATGEHFTCVHSWIGCGSLEKKEIVGNDRVFALDYKVNTIRIGKFDVPEPLKEAPAYTCKLYKVAIDTQELVTEINWEASASVAGCSMFQRGLVHLTKEASLLHAKALLSFTTTELPK
jgi:hypothetical protein